MTPVESDGALRSGNAIADLNRNRSAVYIERFPANAKPNWSVLLPALGILMLLPLALRKAFTYRSGPEGERLIRLMDWRRAVDRWRSRLHLRSV